MAPDGCPLRGIECAQFALGAERVETTCVVRRRGARSVAAHALPEIGRPRVGPEFSSRLHVVGGSHFMIAALLDRERAAVGHDERRVSAAHWLLPQRREAFAGPRRANCAGHIPAIAVGATKIGPHGARCRWIHGTRFALCRCGSGRRRAGLSGDFDGHLLRHFRGGRNWFRRRRHLTLAGAVGLQRIDARSRDEARHLAAAVDGQAVPGGRHCDRRKRERQDETSEYPEYAAHEAEYSVQGGFPRAID